MPGYCPPAPSRNLVVVLGATAILVVVAALVWPIVAAPRSFAAHRDSQLTRALIETAYGEVYRALPPSPGWPPLTTLHARFPELKVGNRVAQAFAAKENGYVLASWVEGLPPATRQDFLFGLDLIISDSGQDPVRMEELINRFHRCFLALNSAPRG